jgi:hypothetical protein
MNFANLKAAEPAGIEGQPHVKRPAEFDLAGTLFRLQPKRVAPGKRQWPYTSRSKDNAGA